MPKKYLEIKSKTKDSPHRFELFEIENNIYTFATKKSIISLSEILNKWIIENSD